MIFLWKNFSENPENDIFRIFRGIFPKKYQSSYDPLSWRKTIFFVSKHIFDPLKNNFEKKEILSHSLYKPQRAPLSGPPTLSLSNFRSVSQFSNILGPSPGLHTMTLAHHYAQKWHFPDFPRKNLNVTIRPHKTASRARLTSDLALQRFRTAGSFFKTFNVYFYRL